VLLDETHEEVLAARARLAVAHARREAALDRLALLQGAEHSLQVQAAAAAVAQAEAVVEQARASVGQAEAELNAMDAQLEKLVVRAPVAGVVLTRSLEPGEVVLAGAEVIVLGRMETLTITVYVPEDRYGQIRLGDVAAVTADSFPGVTFRATVSRIADEAEFTPRNVQTEEGRRTTVFAVILSLEDPQGRLKPGMPADVTFSLPGEDE
jgi:multidrug resistance efflux pump